MLTVSFAGNCVTGDVFQQYNHGSGECIMPVFFSDNFVTLMPGEERVLTMKLNDRDIRGEKPGVVISGYNL